MRRPRRARPIAEKLITFAKRGDLHARRQVLRFVTSEAVVVKLFDTIAPELKDRAGGYTRILKLGNRRGDGAPLALLELVNAPEAKEAVVEDEKDKKTKKKTEDLESAAATKDEAKKKRKAAQGYAGSRQAT